MMVDAQQTYEEPSLAHVIKGILGKLESKGTMPTEAGGRLLAQGFVGTFSYILMMTNSLVYCCNITISVEGLLDQVQLSLTIRMFIEADRKSKCAQKPDMQILKIYFLSLCLTYL